MTAATACRTCGTEPREVARFCDGCGAPITERDAHAEYKQVTVLFAEVVIRLGVTKKSGRGEALMLTWRTVENRRSTIEAHLDGYTYTIMEGDDLDEWATQITDPNGGVQDYEVHNTIGEAKEYCERTAAAVQADYRENGEP